MPDEFVTNFAANYITPKMIHQKRVLEVGIELGLKGHIIFYRPHEFKGTNVTKREGNDVDVIVSVHKLSAAFGGERFDFVYSTEVLEHISDWRSAIYNMKYVLSRGGYIFLSTRSIGYRYHGAAYGDYWRFEIEDMKFIFSDFNIIKVERDNSNNGIAIIAQKPRNYEKVSDLSNYALFSILSKKKEIRVPRSHFLYRIYRLKTLIREVLVTGLERILA